MKDYSCKSHFTAVTDLIFLSGVLNRYYFLLNSLIQSDWKVYMFGAGISAKLISLLSFFH